VSSEGQAADYIRLGRQAASRAGRKVLAPIAAVRQQKVDLARAEAALRDARAALSATRAELQDVTKQLEAAELDRDTRRAPDEVEQVIARVQAEHLSDLTAPALRDLALAVRDLEANHLTGVVVEAGTALGGSALVLAAAKAPERSMKVYDLVEGLFQNTTELDELVALAHVDGDGYDSTMRVLEHVAPLLVSGGRIVLDDYETSPGCRGAVDDYFRDRHMDFRFEQHQRPHVVRR
jgi:hypothetical protein